MDVVPFQEFIKKKCGLVFDEARLSTLVRGVAVRMKRRSFDEAALYLRCLKNDDDEFNNLVHLISIHETYFYREPAHFRVLVEDIVPRLLSVKSGHKIAILSGGCSTGEEPYSIVMALLEKYGSRFGDLFTVLGVDIDREAIAKAKQGIFGSNSFRSFPRELKEKYFAVHDGAIRLRDDVRAGVRFEALNLCDDNYPPFMDNLSIIFYRNVAIYFDAETQKKIFLRLGDCLCEDGYIFVSATETLSHLGKLAITEVNGVFLYRKKIDLIHEDRPGARRASPLQAVKWRPPPGVAEISRKNRPERFVVPAGRSADDNEGGDQIADTAGLLGQALEEAKLKNYGEALRLLDVIIGNDPSCPGAYALKTGILLNTKRFEEAKAVCAAMVEKDRWCRDAFLLSGLIARIEGDGEKAMQYFRQAIYIQTSCWLAHFYLAEIFRLRGEREKAVREYEIVLNLLRKGNAADQGFIWFTLSFSLEQVSHLCTQNLLALKRKLP